MENVITGLSKGAEWFIGLFQKGGEQFIGLVSGTLPTLIVLMVAINSLIKIIGYILLPLVSVFFLGNPMCYTFGRFLKEEHKAGFYDAAVSFVHPITGLFPHANAGELFVWLGISAGLTTLGKETTTLALWYFIVGLIVIFIRGIVTEKMYAFLTRKNRATNKA